MRPALVCLSALLVALPSAAQKDTVRVGTPATPSIRASEDTSLMYTGGVPAAFTGALDPDDSTYNRVVTCTGLSGVGTAVAFDTLTITNTLGTTANFVVFGSQVGGAGCPDPGGPDTFFTLYDTTFNPAAPLTNCLTANDDISGGTNRCSSLTFTIPAGAVRVVALAAFDNASLGTGQFSYQVNFTGTSPVELLDFQID